MRLLLLRALAAAWLLASPSASMRAGCGVSHYAPPEAAIMAQTYAAAAASSGGNGSSSRDLQSQTYSGSAFQYSAAAAAALGLMAPMRMIMVYDVIQSGDANST